MSVAIAPPPFDAASAMDNIAELLQSLGDIPPERVLLHPTPGTATEADVVRWIDGEPKRLVELVSGTLVEKAMGLNESEVAMLVVMFMNMHAIRNKLGIVYGPDGTVRMRGGNIRIPDVMFVPWSGLPEGDRPQRPISVMGATLVIEVLSESNRKEEMRKKRVDYFASGVPLVWEFDPEQKTVDVYTDVDGPPRIMDRDATLSAHPAFPGFELHLPEFWSILERKRPAGH